MLHLRFLGQEHIIVSRKCITLHFHLVVGIFRVSVKAQIVSDVIY
jgi:hypothetical protein